MANYERQILIPYLQDICSIELICSKLTNEATKSNNRVKQLQRTYGAKLQKPSYPQPDEKKADIAPHLAPLIIGALITFAGIMWLVKVSFFWLIGAAGIGFGALIMFVGIDGIREEKDKVNEYFSGRIHWYNHALKEYNDKVAALPSIRIQLDREKNTRANLVNELNRAIKLKNDLYAVNIIPLRYRNIHSAYYLYDFMSTGRETDLEKVIQTFILEEIKKRLDIVIEQNHQILVNQRIQIAMQEHQNTLIAENHRDQMRQLAKIEHNQNMQTEYLQMIEKNQEVTNYILTADYVRKYYH